MAAAMHSGRVQVVHVAHNVSKAVRRKTSLSPPPSNDRQARPRCPQSERNEDRLGRVLLGAELVPAHIAQEPGDKAEPPAPPGLEQSDQPVSRPGSKADGCVLELLGDGPPSKTEGEGVHRGSGADDGESAAKGGGARERSLRARERWANAVRYAKAVVMATRFSEFHMSGKDSFDVASVKMAVGDEAAVGQVRPT